MRLVSDALQHIRTSLRWDALEQENEAIKKAKQRGEKYKSVYLSNGDTLKELLARSRHLLYKYESEWTINQAKRAAILFEKYPTLRQAYQLTIAFRNIYKATTKYEAEAKFKEWIILTSECKIVLFNSVINSIQHHLENILNFFIHRNTNANAESFNSKIKGFRANLRGVTDIKFFLFRLSKLFA